MYPGVYLRCILGASSLSRVYPVYSATKLLSLAVGWRPMFNLLTPFPDTPWTHPETPLDSPRIHPGYRYSLYTHWINTPYMAYQAIVEYIHWDTFIKAYVHAICGIWVYLWVYIWVYLVYPTCSQRCIRGGGNRVSESHQHSA